MEEVIEKLVKNIAKEIVGSGASALGMSDKVIKIYQKHLKLCTYSALIPVPGVASVALVSSVWSMYIEINNGFGLKFSDNVIKTIAGGISANIAGFGVGAIGGVVGSTIGEALKAIPGIGSLLGAGVSALANHTAMATSAMVYLQMLEKLVIANGRNVSDSDLLNSSMGKYKNSNSNDIRSVSTVYCPNCGQDYSSSKLNSYGLLTCTKCGSTCTPSRNKPNVCSDYDVFCPNCGKKHSSSQLNNYGLLKCTKCGSTCTPSNKRVYKIECLNCGEKYLSSEIDYMGCTKCNKCGSFVLQSLIEDEKPFLKRRKKAVSTYISSEKRKLLSDLLFTLIANVKK